MKNQEALLRRLAPGFADILRELERAGVGRVLLVDDHSRDGTYRLARAVAAADPRVAAVRSDLPPGQANAYAAGVRALPRATAAPAPETTAVASCDLDHLLEPLELGRFLAAFDGSRSAIRGVRERAAAGRRSPLRAAGHALASALVRLAPARGGGPPPRDAGSSLCVLRADRAAAVERVRAASGTVYLPLVVARLCPDIEDVQVRFAVRAGSSYRLLGLVRVLGLLVRTLLIVARRRLPGGHGSKR